MNADGLKHRGFWWLPDSEGRKLNGTLTFDYNSGTLLDLNGWFKGIEDINKTLMPEIILGISANGKKITLYKNIEKSTTHNPAGFPISVFSTNVVFEGEHFSTADSIKFKNISMSYSYIDDWIDIHLFKTGDWMYKSPSQIKEISISYDVPEPIKAEINNDYLIEISFRPTFHLPWSGDQQAWIKQKIFVDVHFSESKSFEQIMSINSLLKYFLSLAVLESVKVLSFEANSANDNRDKMPLKIYYKSINAQSEIKKLSSYNILFTYRDVSEEFEHYLRNWFKNAELLRPVYDLYFSTIHSPSMYVDNQFLNFFHAIEAFHRRVIGGSELSDEDHKKRMSEIVDSIPTQYKGWLESKLLYSNELTQRKRLKELLKTYWKILSPYITDLGGFIDKVVATRNYMTHYDQSLMEHAAFGLELIQLSKNLEIIIEVCLLSQIGFQIDQIKNLLERSKLRVSYSTGIMRIISNVVYCPRKLVVPA
jgi:hypothetical protein